MQIGCNFRLLAPLVMIGLIHSLQGALPEHSISPSRQFIIYGANTTTRGEISQIAEQIKADLLHLLRQPDRWKWSIVVNLQAPQANVPELPKADLRFAQTGFGLKIQLDLIVESDVDAAQVERDLLRAILLEMTYRRDPNVAPGAAFVAAPDWLIDAVRSAEPGRDRQPLMGALAVSDKTTPLDEFLRQRPELLDAPGRLVYRAHAFALLQLLLNESDGPSQLFRFVESLAQSTNDPAADLKKYFPGLKVDGKDLWRVSIANLGTPEGSLLLGCAETERRLEDLLGSSKPLEVLLSGKLSEQQKARLRSLSEELLVLTARANPVIRPIVHEYQQVVASMAIGKGRKLAQRLAKLKRTRSELNARLTSIDDYLNWFEATQSKTRSDIFADYLKAAAKPAEDAPRRRDSLSVYLDSLEGQFQEKLP